jgi:hypothetical protein
MRIKHHDVLVPMRPTPPDSRYYHPLKPSFLHKFSDHLAEEIVVGTLALKNLARLSALKHAFDEVATIGG